VIVVDTNLLLYAHHEGSRHHGLATRWFQEVMNGDETIGLPLVAILGFLRVGTNPRIFLHPFTMDEALDIVDSWTERPSVRVLTPTPRHWTVLRDVASSGQAKGARLTDAHIAALTIEHGGTLATNDRGFARFPRLKVRYPLAS